jgi:hypothetical protein
MATATLKQSNQGQAGFKTPLQGTIPMADEAVPPVLVATGAFLSSDDNGAKVLNFQQWGPSDAVIDSWTFVPVGNHYHLTITFHGTGNLTGKGNDDTYTSGNFQCDVSYGEGNSAGFTKAVMTLTYTD